MAAIIADATGEPLEPPAKGADTETAAAAAKPAETDAPKEDAAAKADEDGLTDAERKDLTRKMQAAIGKRHRQMREAQEQAERDRAARRLAEERAEQAERDLAKLRTVEKIEPKAAEDSRPNPANFVNNDEYVEALAGWIAERKLAERDAKTRADKERAEQERIIKEAGARIARARELVPDFDDVTGSIDVPVPAHIAGYMQESDLFAELGYYFALHQEELARISALSVPKSLVEIGKIESRIEPFAAMAKVESKPNGAEPSTTDDSPSRSRASAPVIRPLSPRGATQTEKPAHEMNSREAIAAYERRAGANLTKRSRH